MSIIVFYFLQGELGESLELPNALAVSSLSGKVTFGEFLKKFPFSPHKSYKFRFQMEDKNHGYVWLDVSAPNEVLPSYGGRITAKVLNIQSIALERRTQLRFKLKSEIMDSMKENKSDVSNAAGPAPKLQAPSNSYTSSPRAPASGPSKVNSNPGTMSNPVSAPIPSPSSVSSRVPPIAQSNSAKPKATNIGNPPTTSSTSFTNVSNSSNSFSSSANTSFSPTVAASVTVDLIGFDDHPSTFSTAAPSASKSGNVVDIDIDIDDSPTSSDNVLTHDDHVANRKADIDRKVKDALEFKQELDKIKVKEEDEFHAAKEAHDNRLNTWAFNGKEKRNVRTLLSTMQTVLWPGNNWKPLGLGDLLDPKQVKLAYRKAMLVVHPDRCSNMDSETKFIAKRVFEAVNEAYQDFLKKENVA